MKRYTSFFAILSVLIACSANAAQQPITTITSGTGTSGKTLKAYNDNDMTPRLTDIDENFTDLYTNKEPSAHVGATAPADTTQSFLDTDEEPGILIQKKYVIGTGWVRVGSHGVQYATSCAGITAGMCVSTDGKLYYHNGTAVVEVGTGSGGIVPIGTENQVPVYNSSGSLTPTTPLTPVAGKNVTLTTDEIAGTVTIAASGGGTVPSAGIVTSNGTSFSSITPGTGVTTALAVAVDGTGGLASKSYVDSHSGSGNGYLLYMGYRLKNTVTSGSISYWGALGLSESSSSYARAASVIPVSGTITSARAYISTSDAQPATGSQVCVLYVDAVASTLTITFAAGTSGVYTSTGSATLSVGSTLAWGCTNNASTSAGTVNTISMVVQ